MLDSMKSAMIYSLLHQVERHLTITTYLKSRVLKFFVASRCLLKIHSGCPSVSAESMEQLSSFGEVYALQLHWHSRWWRNLTELEELIMY